MGTLVTSLSSASTPGAATLILDPKAKATTVQIGLASSSSGYVTLNMTLADPTQVANNTAYWTAISSAVSMATSQVGGVGGNLIYSILVPCGGVQIYSSGTNGVIYLSALQSVTA